MTQTPIYEEVRRALGRADRSVDRRSFWSDDLSGGAVERDLDCGYVSRATAESVYGAVVAEETQIAPGRARYQLDAEASARRRKDMAAAAAGATTDTDEETR